MALSFNPTSRILGKNTVIQAFDSITDLVKNSFVDTLNLNKKYIYGSLTDIPIRVGE